MSPRGEYQSNGLDVVQIGVKFDEQGPFEISTCPLDLKEVDDSWKAILEYEHLEEGRKQLLSWFKHNSNLKSDSHPRGDIKAELTLQSSLSKADRAQWHGCASAMGLASASKGTGSARHLCIYTETLAQLGTGQSMSMLEPKLREKVKGVWRACQAEGGKFWGYSQDEIAELLMSSAGLPEDIAQLMLKREKASEMANFLHLGLEDQALNALNELPSVVHVQDEVSSGYAIHIACFYGLEKVVKHLLGRNGILEQRDGGYCSALDIARARGHEELARILEGAGATHSSNKGDHRRLHLMGDKYIAPSLFKNKKNMLNDSQRNKQPWSNKAKDKRESSRADQHSWRANDD